MFVFLSKILPLLVYPLGLTLLLILTGLLVKRREKLRTFLLVFALLLLFGSSNKWAALSLVRSLEWRYQPPASYENADVIILLGGSTEAASYPRTSVEINSTGDRILHAASLYRQGIAPRILVSGGGLEFEGPAASSPAGEMTTLLQFLGVPQNAIWLEPASQNTYENAVNACRMLKEAGLTRAYLVTSAMHMPRSLALFQKQGCSVIPAPTDYNVTFQGWEDLWHPRFPGVLVDLLPNANHLALLTSALKEYLGMAIYSLRGWMP